MAKDTQFWNLISSSVKSLELAPSGTTAFGPNQCLNDPDGAVDHDERVKVTGVATGLYDARLGLPTDGRCRGEKCADRSGQAVRHRGQGPHRLHRRGAKPWARNSQAILHCKITYQALARAPAFRNFSSCIPARTFAPLTLHRLHEMIVARARLSAASSLRQPNRRAVRNVRTVSDLRRASASCSGARSIALGRSAVQKAAEAHISAVR